MVTKAPEKEYLVTTDRIPGNWNDYLVNRLGAEIGQGRSRMWTAEIGEVVVVFDVYKDIQRRMAKGKEAEAVYQNACVPLFYKLVVMIFTAGLVCATALLVLTVAGTIRVNPWIIAFTMLAIIAMLLTVCVDINQWREKSISGGKDADRPNDPSAS